MLEALNQFANLAEVLVVIVAAIGIFFSVNTVKNQIKAQTFLDFTSRYDGIAIDLFRHVGGSRFSDLKKEHMNNDNILQAATSLTNLFLVEWHSFKSGMIDKSTWLMFDSGIRYMMRTEGMRRSWEMNKISYDFVPEFQKYIDEIVND